MSRIVLILLPVAILSSVFLSCSIESDARGNVLKESEIFLADNFRLENSEDFLRDCLFPVAFREKWLGDWDTTLQAMIKVARQIILLQLIRHLLMEEKLLEMLMVVILILLKEQKC